jgi:hypothetical protein
VWEWKYYPRRGGRHVLDAGGNDIGTAHSSKWQLYSWSKESLGTVPCHEGCIVRLEAQLERLSQLFVGSSCSAEGNGASQGLGIREIYQNSQNQPLLSNKRADTHIPSMSMTSGWVRQVIFSLYKLVGDEPCLGWHFRTAEYGETLEEVMAHGLFFGSEWTPVICEGNGVSHTPIPYDMGISCPSRCTASGGRLSIVTY